MKHTEGPWRVYSKDDDEHVYYPGIDAGSGSIVVFGTEDEAGSGIQGNTHEEVLSNAHRIVSCVNGCEGVNPEAVKDMLEALKLVLSERVLHGNHSIESMKKVKLAIEKATA